MATSLLQDLLSALTLRDTRLHRSGRRAAAGATPATVIEQGERLLRSDGEASSIGIARHLLDGYAELDSAARADFFQALREQFGPAREEIDDAYEAYCRTGGEDDALARLFDAAEPRRQELLRRLNLAPGGTRELVEMRADLTRMLKTHPELAVVDRDFAHLLGSWFNRGFLVLRRIDWDTPASILEKLIEYESVHAIEDWDDLRRRLDPADRRCFAFFHPALGDEPLVFLEVALTKGIPDNIQQIIDVHQTPVQRATPDTAAFFGISNCQAGLRGISLGNFLIKQVVQELKHELPTLRTFVTLSPVPGFADWLGKVRSGALSDPELSGALRESLNDLDQPNWHADAARSAALRDAVVPLAAWYLARARNAEGYPLDPVARFHLRNGAYLERINWLGDRSEKGMKQSHGLMVNYVYDLERIEENHEAFMNEARVTTSRAIRRVLRTLTDHRETNNDER